MSSISRTETYRVQQLIQLATEGDFVLPIFQREGLKWNQRRVLDLLDSVARGYPIGSLLLWKPSEQERREMALTLLSGEPVGDEPARFIILDGQQRLRSIVGALTGKGEPPADGDWDICYDLKNGDFIEQRGRAVEPHQVPLAGIFDSLTWIDVVQRIKRAQDGRDLAARADRFVATLRDFLVPVTVLEGASFDLATDIFGRINRTGTHLSEADLLAAKLWKSRFDFRRWLERLRERLPQGFRELSEATFMRSLAAAHSNQVDIAKVRQLHKASAQDLQRFAEACSRGVERAVDWLRQVDVPSLWYVPYELQLTLLSDVFRVHDAPLPAEMDEALRRWFWATSFCGFFAGASTGERNQGLKQLRLFASQQDAAALDWFQQGQRIAKADDTRNLRSVRSKLACMVMAWHGPRRLSPELASPTREELLASEGPVMQHIFPRASANLRGALANFLFLEGATLPDALQATTLPTEVLESHLIKGPQMIVALREERVDDFLSLRKDAIDQAERDFLSRFGLTMDP